MGKIKSLEELKKISKDYKKDLDLRKKPAHPEALVQVKVAMATCGIASGAKEIMEYLDSELVKRDIDALVTKTGCMGYCYAEPTIEVTLPGKEPVVYGNVTREKADEIIEKYIKTGELMDGIIPQNYETI